MEQIDWCADGGREYRSDIDPPASDDPYLRIAEAYEADVARARRVLARFDAHASSDD